VSILAIFPGRIILQINTTCHFFMQKVLQVLPGYVAYCALVPIGASWLHHGYLSKVGKIAWAIRFLAGQLVTGCFLNIRRSFNIISDPEALDEYDRNLKPNSTDLPLGNQNIACPPTPGISICFAISHIRLTKTFFFIKTLGRR